LCPPQLGQTLSCTAVVYPEMKKDLGVTGLEFNYFKPLAKSM